MTLKKRNVRIDIIKGIAIILMVMGHSGAPFTSFIYLFHMAIFFIASGYLFDCSYVNSIGSLLSFIKRKIKGLWFPFFLWNTIFALLHNLFICINVYTNNEMFLVYCNNNDNYLTEYWNINDILKCVIKSIFFADDVQLGGAFWFFKILFAISIMYAVIEYIWFKICDNNDSVLFQTIISIILLFIGYYYNLKNINIFSIQIVFSCYCLYHLGVLFKYKQKMVYSQKVHLILLVGSFVILTVLNNWGSISLGINRYPNPIFYVAASYLGWIFVSEIAYFVEKSSLLKKYLGIVGSETLSIMVLHFLCFKIISYFGVFLDNQQYYLVAAFPVLFKDGLWWVAYTVIGVVLPIILHKLWKLCVQKLF